MARLKTCSKCGVAKPLSQFHKNGRGRKGRMSRCKKCHNAQSAKYRAAHRDQVRARDRHRNHQQHRIDQKDEYRVMKRRQWRAKTTLSYHVKKGNVVPWPVCALPICEEKPEAHHPDYDAPLGVVWLCPSHHQQAHVMVRAM